MRGVAGRVGDLERAVEQSLAAAQHGQIALGDRNHLAPQAVHVVAVQAAGALDQPRRIEHVPGAPLVDVDLELGPALDERAAGAGVVEMDVGQQQRARSLVAERIEQRRQDMSQALGRSGRRRPASSRSRARDRGA